MYKIKLEQFEGPLDLLLQLIENEELDITSLSLSKVADQYLEYVTGAEDLDLEEMSDFLVVAAKLLLIKSKTLLPTLCLGDDEECDDLERQLKIYKEYLEASKKLNKMISGRNFTFCRDRLPSSAEKPFALPEGLDGNVLAVAFREILRNLEPLVSPPEKTIKRVVSLKEKIRHIRDLVFGKGKVSFSQLMKQSESKVELIVNFLALLELVKEKQVSVSQGDLFQDISIESKLEESKNPRLVKEGVE